MGRATVFLSHAWLYKFVEVVKGLRAFADAEQAAGRPEPLLVVAEVDGLREPGLPEDVGALRGVVVRARGHGLILAAARSRVRSATSGRLLVTSQARPGRIQ